MRIRLFHVLSLYLKNRDVFFKKAINILGESKKHCARNFRKHIKNILKKNFQTKGQTCDQIVEAK